MSTLKQYLAKLADDIRQSKVNTKQMEIETIRACLDLNNALNRVKQTLFYSLPCGHIIEDDCECRQRGNA